MNHRLTAMRVAFSVHAMRAIRAGWFPALVMLGMATLSWAVPSPTETVRTTVDEVVSILRDPNWKKPTRLVERRKLLEQVIGSRFDYPEMAKRTLTIHWSKLSPAEKKEFVELLAAFLSANYADKIESYSSEEVLYLAERLSDGYAEVTTKITSEKAEYPLDYRLLLRLDEWYVYDVVIDGVSLVKNYRSQFDRIIRSGSYADLVEKLRKNVQERQLPKSTS
jgi:phospholipid transport system substrate-binding protein